MKKKIIVIGGPTCIGKTDLCIKLAEHFKSEIISADARQFYEKLNIGVAKPTNTQLKKIKHHFIGHLSIEDKYSIGEYEKDTLAIIKKLFKKYNLLFVCGGSGLYIDSVCEGLHQFPKVNESIKHKIQTTLEKKGINYLNNQLKLVDPETYRTIDRKNPRRVTRALEVYEVNQIPYSHYKKEPKEKREFETIFISLQESRETLYEKINKRVDKMIEMGLVQEAKELYTYRNHQALKTIGYTEIFNYLNQKYTLPEAIKEIKKNTRRYAKRQINWFNNAKYHKFKIGEIDNIRELINN
jgi:tRNA dimethylallyltransferase